MVSFTKATVSMLNLERRADERVAWLRALSHLVAQEHFCFLNSTRYVSVNTIKEITFMNDTSTISKWRNRVHDTMYINIPFVYS